MSARKVVLSYGMGVDSTAILLRWLVDPSSRDFELADLVVVTAQTGDEYTETGELVERHVLPRLAAAGVRFVEIARAQRSQKKGSAYAVIQDTRAPERLHLEGLYKLSDEMLESGTVPQSGGGHLCSIKSKAVPIEAFLEDAFGTEDRRHAIGYSAEETSRIAKDLREREKRGTLELEARYTVALGYSDDEAERRRADKATRVRGEKAQAAAFFPLLDWAWGRAECVAYIAEQTGATWPKSACTYCPFSQGKDKAEAQARFAAQPLETIKGLMMETTARALNPKAGKLFKTKSLRDVLEAQGNEVALRAFELSLASSTWALYRVRRQWRATKKAGKFNAGRSIEIVEKGSRDAMIEALELLAESRELLVEAEGDAFRVVVKAEPQADGAQDEAFAVAPASAVEKTGPTFKAELWREA